MDDVSWQFYPLPLLHKCTYISSEYTYSWTKLLLSCLGIVLQYYRSWGKYSINLFCADVPNYFITFLLFYSECFPVLSNKFTELNGNIITKWIDQKQPSRGVLRKGVLKICSKFTGEHPCRSEITLRHGCSPVNLLHVFRTHFLNNTSGWLLLQIRENINHGFLYESGLQIWIRKSPVMKFLCLHQIKIL